MEKAYYTTGDLAKLCQVDPSTIFRAIHNHTLQAFKTPGGHYRIPISVAEKFLKEMNFQLADSPNRTKRVLIVEDNPVELKFFQRTLSQNSSLSIKGTKSGYEAGFLTKTFKPDIIFLDIFLGEHDGRSIAKLLRGDPDFRNIKIIGMTGTKNKKDLKEIQEGPFDHILLKPISVEKLNAFVKGLLK